MTVISPNITGTTSHVKTQVTSIIDPVTKSEYVADQVIVRYNTKKFQDSGVLNAYIMDSNAKIGAKVWKDFGGAGLSGLQVVKLTSNISVKDAIYEYQKNPDVVYAQPNYVYHTTALTPNDPSFNLQWGLHNTGQQVNGIMGTSDADIDAPEAWDVSTGSGTVIIAVIDSGIHYTHPDLMSNMWTNVDEILGNGIDDDDNGYIDDVYGWNFYNGNNDPNDGNAPLYHGTHCAGILGAVGNNSVGVCGVNWNVKIMSLRTTDASGSSYTSDDISAINYANANGASIISNSWGGYDYDQALKDAIDNSPTVMVCAAGNDNRNTDTTPFYPASFNSPNIISVAATDPSDNKVSFSNYGQTSVDLAAPGVNIYSTKKASDYQFMSGTSMATPFVAGVAALIKSVNPNLTNIQIKNIILNNVDVKPSLTGLVNTGGRLNAYKAVLEAQSTWVIPVANFTGYPRSGAAPLTVSFTDLSTNATGWNWSFGDGEFNTTQNPVHIYLADGNYDLSLNVSNSAGFNVMIKTRYIIVANRTFDKTSVYRPGVGFYLKMDNGSTWNPSTDVYLAWDNAASDRPIAGDWNKDGRTETGVYRPGVGFYLKMDNGSTWTPSTDVYLAWDNAVGDRPIAGDWNMDGRAETGVYRHGVGFYLKMDNGSTWTPSTDVYLAWDNAVGDRPIAGDWNADGRTETGVYRPGVGFYLKMDNGSIWSPSTDQYLAWDNYPTDLPIAGDWNGDGRAETGVYRPGSGFYLKMDNGSTWNPSTDQYLAWDNWPTDLPFAGNFV